MCLRIGDYRLAEGSPARGAARPHEGCARSQDIGAAGRMPPADPDAEEYSAPPRNRFRSWWPRFFSAK